MKTIYILLILLLVSFAVQAQHPLLSLQGERAVTPLTFNYIGTHVPLNTAYNVIPPIVLNTTNIRVNNTYTYIINPIINLNTNHITPIIANPYQNYNLGNIDSNAWFTLTN